MEDYAVLTFGAPIFKIARLLTIALIMVHLFACAYYRVKKETTDVDDFDSFFTARNVDPAVSPSPRRTHKRTRTRTRTHAHTHTEPTPSLRALVWRRKGGARSPVWAFSRCVRAVVDAELSLMRC